jgi:hypothetical protein
MIQLSQTEVLTNSGGIPKLAEEFAITGCARLPGFLTPPILKPLLDWVYTAQFNVRNEISKTGSVFGTTLFAAQTDRSVFLLHFILNRPALFRAVEQVTACPTLGNFRGRLHRTSALPDQHIDWHSDAVETRTVGISINLSTEQYSGGVLQIRNPDGAVAAEIGRADPGDAFLFRIDHDWQHRLTPVESGSRTVGVGWFRTAPDWREDALSVARARLILARSGLGTPAN